MGRSSKYVRSCEIGDSDVRCSHCHIDGEAFDEDRGDVASVRIASLNSERLDLLETQT